jgi:hypothetical protein
MNYREHDLFNGVMLFFFELAAVAALFNAASR